MITLTTPARSEFVHLLRTVAAGVGSSVDLSIDDIDDLRLAVDEACAHLLKVDPDAGSMKLRIERNPRSVEVAVSLLSSSRDDALDGSGQFLTWHILAALTDGAVVEQEPDGPVIRFTKRATA